jgi:RecJ-like exonuclease
MYYDEDGEEITPPMRWEICTRCEGEGTHTNPNIDGNGITASEWEEWDDDERDGYMSGRYDVACDECNGSGKIHVVDLERCTPEVRAIVESTDQAEHEQRAEAAYWRRAEAWACGERD